MFWSVGNNQFSMLPSLNGRIGKSYSDAFAIGGENATLHSFLLRSHDIRYKHLHKIRYYYFELRSIYSSQDGFLENTIYIWGGTKKKTE